MNEHPLRAYRQRHGLTLKDLADRADTSDATISRVENGQLQPTFPLLRRLVAACRGEVTGDDLLQAKVP